FGAIHRNTFINAPDLLTPELDLKINSGVYFAGQIIGVEGYVESVAMGLLAALSAVMRIKGQKYVAPPADTALGALLNHVTGPARSSYQPMNINYGLFQVPKMKNRNKRERNTKIAQTASESLAQWMEGVNREMGSAA
ncbi:MAG: FAD-dependent oxidoreductase, partial [Nitrospinaceae bacterium]|nr:FAD-dependent oxidoreductase [Nitrospinaceae bacterium]